jgi:hypothetical protein
MSHLLPTGMMKGLFECSSLGGGFLKAGRQGATNAKNLKDHDWIIFAKKKDVTN